MRVAAEGWDRGYVTITSWLNPFLRYTTSARPGCFPDDRLSMRLPCRRIDVIGQDIGVVGELFIPASTLAVLAAIFLFISFRISEFELISRYFS